MAGVRYRDGDGKPKPVPFFGVKLAACCDCGLVHRHTYAVVDGKIMETVERDNRATDGIRRAMAKRHEIVAEREANVYVIMQRIRRKRKRGPLKVIAQRLRRTENSTRQMACALGISLDARHWRYRPEPVL